eukprot:CAMPEP_0194132740 /NCGR_PEP_ID=MMETSP0152-20130528/3145_1 /TAXON_ID=1049557 /ORGANISM="Thalassiothrix antarctica, Strain L6-D1" /LENGTH=337 /DNA_ID=CAMNT_0038827899 /DNA_START=103 /DNA_END=1116 /DNA_ORIENTATION=+
MVKLHSCFYFFFFIYPVVISSSSATTTTKLGSVKNNPSLLDDNNNDNESALEIADLEQRVEDYNAKWIASAPSHGKACTHRRLICLPLNEKFNPPMGGFSHDHVQTGDKMSLPRNYWTAIEKTKAEVPWLMKVERIPGGGWTKKRFDPSKYLVSPKEDNESDDDEEEEEDDDDEEEDGSNKSRTVKKITNPLYLPGTLNAAVGSLLDCRAPSNYCFLPWWMMRGLGLHPRDVVDVTLIEDVPPGSMARLRPHSSEFAKDISNPQAVLETELKHYSSLTKGAVIAMDYNNKRYWFDIVDLRSSPHNEKCDMVKVQDCDLSTDFLPARDTLKKKRRQDE